MHFRYQPERQAQFGGDKLEPRTWENEKLLPYAFIQYPLVPYLSGQTGDEISLKVGFDDPLEEAYDEWFGPLNKMAEHVPLRCHRHLL